MPDAPLTVVAGMVSRLLEVSRQLGVEPRSILEEANLDGEFVAERDNRVPVAKYARLWTALGRRLPDRVLALDWAASWKPSDLGIFGYVMTQSDNMGGALDISCRYGRLIDEGALPRLVRSERSAVLSYAIAPAYLACQHGPEAVGTTVAAFLRMFLDPEFVPLSVQLPTPRTDRTPALEKFFHSPVEHSRGGSVVVELPLELLDRPCPGADPILAAYLRQTADALLSKVGSSTSLTQEVARRISEKLGTGEPGQATIARQMGLSERTLQRRLAGEGTSFQAILEEARRSIALGYLADRRFAAYEVSFMLGYAEPATFFRAFKRWTGKTPQEYRATLA
jgi:AraC-like DNA-binding protein